MDETIEVNKQAMVDMFEDFIAWSRNKISDKEYSVKTCENFKGQFLLSSIDGMQTWNEPRPH